MNRKIEKREKVTENPIDRKVERQEVKNTETQKDWEVFRYEQRNNHRRTSSKIYKSVEQNIIAC